ncbi:MAG: TonB-dependent receptor [Cyclobacteriaceae bacterium]|nr:TonB-dependent receptor [Cyclobacteriaceae bacterium]
MLTPYLGYYDQYIYLAPKPEFSDLPAGGQIFQYTQNDALFLGFELNFEYEFVEHFTFNTATEYVWNKNLDTSLPLPFTPPFSIYGEVEYGKNVKDSWVRYFAVGVNYHFFAAQNRVDRNERPTEGYSLVSISGGFDFKMRNQTAQFRLSVNNLLDKAYMNHLSRYRLLNLPEQGRNIIIALSMPFEL